MPLNPAAVALHAKPALALAELMGAERNAAEVWTDHYPMTLV